MSNTPTQVRRPWRAVTRTVFQAAVSAAAVAPAVYEAATHNDPAAATGAAGFGLVIAGGITRVMALPGVNGWLARFVPFLAAEPKAPTADAGAIVAHIPTADAREIQQSLLRLKRQQGGGLGL